MHWGAAVAALVAATFIFGLAPVSADHPQDPQGNGTAVAFDHVKGNEWWVEVRVTGDQPFDAVGARDEGGDWVGLAKKDWGVWAGSFHIEPGHDVQFRAVDTASGERTQSCWFTHPGGVERCDGGSEPTGPPATVTFDHKGGNEWWVQASVTGDPSRVQAMDTGGAWTELQFKHWGDWAASFHIEPGHDVRFRAMTGGTWHESCWFTHPGGVTPTGGQTCGTGGDPSTPPSGDFDATFRTSGGNEWWVEVRVDANEALAGVDARDDGGPWIALEKKSWGAWAKSFHVEDGSIVEFRATSKDSDTDISGQYRWPDGTKVAGEPDDEQPAGDADVAFGPKAGNAWWVEAIVVGDHENITSVQGRAEGGAWHTMTYRDWGAWAASFHVPAGSDVQLRATTPSGTDRSAWFTWPDATPVGSNGSWPEEGSYARYDVDISHAPGVHTHRGVDHVYHYGEWWSHSVGWFDHSYGGDDPDTRTPEWDWGRAGPPMCPTDVQPGDEACRGLTVEHAETHETHQEGDKVTVATWYGYNFSESCNGCNDDAGEWDQATGILIGFHNSGTSWSDELLLDTDAPMRTI